MRFLVFIALLIVAGCESEAELRAQAAANRARIDAGDHRTCTGYGMDLGTPAYADCRLRLSQIRAQNRAARNAAALQWYGMQQRQQPVYTPPPARKAPMTTNCTDLGGGMVTCTTQ